MTDEEMRLQREYLAELERLISCYQMASRDDKNVVWAVLNKYVVYLDADMRL